MPLNIIRAWKDRDYRNSLDEEQLAALPENPAGSIDLTALTDDELAYMNGGADNDDWAVPAGLGVASFIMLAGTPVELPALVITGVATVVGVEAGFAVADS